MVPVWDSSAVAGAIAEDDTEACWICGVAEESGEELTEESANSGPTSRADAVSVSGGTGALVEVPENGGVIAAESAAARALAVSGEGSGAELGGAVSCGLNDCGDWDAGATISAVLDGAVIATGS